MSVCINYSGVSYSDESSLKLFHFEGGVWVDRTTSLDTTLDIICADVASLSPFVVLEQAVAIGIDIEPGSPQNTVSSKSNGLVPAAILSNGVFDAGAVVQSSLRFGRLGTEESLWFCNPSLRDVNSDGYKDLLCYFGTHAADFNSDSTQGILQGLTQGGIPFTGSDSVRIVPGR